MSSAEKYADLWSISLKFVINYHNPALNCYKLKLNYTTLYQENKKAFIQHIYLDDYEWKISVKILEDSDL